MKYMTIEWWRGDDELAVKDVFAEYRRHLSTIRGKLSGDLIVVAESQWLHDASLTHLTVDPGEASARIELDCYDEDERITLTYRQLERFESLVHSPGLPGPGGYGHLGYLETDVVASGAFEHRILFSSGIELQLNFRDFRLARARHSGKR